MRSHKYLLFISFSLLIIEIVLFIFMLNKGYLKNGYYIMFCILIMIWVLFYPIGFYTSYRHIGNADSKGNIISTIISSFNDNVVISFFLIPLLLSPFLIFDYCSMLKEDIRKIKWESNFK